jgi:hypothetical protein
MNTHVSVVINDFFYQKQRFEKVLSMHLLIQLATLALVVNIFLPPPVLFIE